MKHWGSISSNSIQTEVILLKTHKGINGGVFELTGGLKSKFPSTKVMQVKLLPTP